MPQPRTLSQPELEIFLSRVADSGPGADLAAHFLAFTGLRLGEYLHLTWSNVVGHSFEPRAELQLRAEWTKNGQPRTVPLPPPLQAKLCDYLASALAANGYHPGLHYPLWPGDEDKGFSARHLQEIFRRVGERHLHRVVTPHMLRHTYATNLLHHSNTRLVQLALGHSSLASTQIYLHPSSADLTRATNLLFQPRNPEKETEA